MNTWKKQPKSRYWGEKPCKLCGRTEEFYYSEMEVAKILEEHRQKIWEEIKPDIELLKEGSQEIKNIIEKYARK